MEVCLFPFHIFNDLWNLTACLSYFLLQRELQSGKEAESVRGLAALPRQQVQAEGDTSAFGRQGLSSTECQDGGGASGGKVWPARVPRAPSDATRRSVWKGRVWLVPSWPQGTEGIASPEMFPKQKEQSTEGWPGPLSACLPNKAVPAPSPAPPRYREARVSHS